MNGGWLIMGKGKTLDIKTVYECNGYLGSKTFHPQASIISFENPWPEYDSVKFGFYAVLLIEECTEGCCCCGRRYYDYSNATMVFLAPGEIFRMGENNMLPQKGWLLAFDTDLLLRTALKSHIGDYTFFSYRGEEALHLSQREKNKAVCCFGEIEEELHHAVDSHSSKLISRYIELLLDYCTRFYERQFITREEKNKTILSKLDRVLDDYIESGKLRNGQLPAPEYCAGVLNLSTGYFNDLLKFETGKRLTEYFQFKRMDAAKRMLLKPGNMPGYVSRQLGFTDMRHFSFIFKKITGKAPGEYMYSQN